MASDKLKSYIAGGALLLFLLLGVMFYLLYLSPLKQQVEDTADQVNQQKSFLEKNSTPAAEKPVVVTDTAALQQEVPVKPLMDQLLLQFEKAEVLSDSLILSMQFTDGEEAAAEPAENEGEGDQEQPAAPDESAAAPEVLPSGVKKITAEMTVMSKDYEGLLSFLQVVQELKRITVIEGITFTGPADLNAESEDAPENQFKYDLQVSTYYLPELTDYLKDTPTVPFPAPSGKKNPLSGSETETEGETD
ncbi:hypothetical protein ACFQPF_15290 [Fictibacillus iocasae]|uniref:Pilus assembly protein PilO n=1 Tax=Fictibacillus iocasae TaxID=2715437 RepID=A0ABW2NUS7_9BACL